MTTHSEGQAGLDLNTLRPGSFIDVETKSRHYLIECLGGSAIRISGHPDYCPSPAFGFLEGSIDREGVVELGLIGRGKRLMFFLNDRGPVTTSRVVDIQVDQPKASPNKSTPSVH